MNNDLTSPPPPSGSPVEPTSVTPVPAPSQQAVAAQPVSIQPAAAQPAAPIGAPVQSAPVGTAQPTGQYTQQPATFQSAPQDTPQAARQSAAQSAAHYASQPVSPYGAPQPPQKKKTSKKPLIISLASIAVVAIIIAAVLVSQEVARSNAYDQAVSSFDQGDYSGAYDEFSALGTYSDAEELARMSSQYARYEEAQELYAVGNYDEAKTLFSQLDSGIGNPDEWIDKCDYALAEQILAAGDPEAAREAFLLLGSFEDAAERAEACTLPFPATGIVYQDSGFYYEYCAIEIDYKYSTGGAFYKVYSGDTLVVSLFLNANTTARVYLKPGSYVLKEGTGDTWYGEELAFGRAGWYSVMTYDDSGTDYITLSEGDLMTITINASSGGNVSDRDEDFSDF